MTRPLVPIERSRAGLRRAVAGWKSAGARVGVVPTMGALHAGHLSLVEAARAACDRVIVTIFVNPRQFNNPADLENYPRTETEDAVKLAPLGVDLIYVPGPDQIYPQGFATTVSVAGLTDCMDGVHRPGHFDGVATVVAKLFTQTGADVAFFGEKDYQQLLVVRRMAADLDLPIEVIGCPTIREQDGLAMSSRNQRLLPPERAVAATLQDQMQAIASALRSGQPVQAAVAAAEEALGRAGFGAVEYIDLRAADTLEPVTDLHRSARLFASAWLGDVRLIDNIAV